MTTQDYMDTETVQHRRFWKWVMLLSLIPGLAYLLVLVVTFGFGLNQPGRWMMETFSTIPYALNAAMVIGSPIISIQAHQILQLPPAWKTNLTDTRGLLIWIVTILCICTMFPIPWLLLAFMD